MRLALIAAAALACARAAAGGGGHDGAFFLESDDASSRLEVSGFAQFRWTGVARDAPERSDFEHGFEMRRLRLTVEGSVLDERVSFKITPSFDRDGGRTDLSDGYFEFAAREDLTLRVGQFKLPLLAEELTSAKRQLAVDRSLSNRVFTLRRSQGVMAELRRGPWRFAGAISDGSRAESTALETDDADFAVTARAERSLAGGFDQFRAFSAPPGETRAWRLGVAAHYELGESRPGEPQASTALWTVDSTWRGDGWNAFAAYIGRSADEDPVAGAALDHAFIAQAGRFLTDDIEAFLRYDGVLPDPDRPGDELFQTVTIGANWYLHAHALKWTADIQWFPDRAGDNDLISSAASVGFLDGGADRNEIALRVQLQVLF